MKRIAAISVVTVLAGLALYSITTNVGVPGPTKAVQAKRSAVDLAGLSVATFAGGCFWCVEAAFEGAPGVREAISGFSGGNIENPTYEQVAYGLTEHTEAVQVYYDPDVITYEGLLQVLWRTADPTDPDGQFSDRGRQYRPAIFYHDLEQKRTAVRAREALERSMRYPDPVTIEITQFKSFYPAQESHQDYYKKNPLRYRFYTIGSGRAGFREETWGDELAIDFTKFRPAQTARQSDKSKVSADM